MATTLNLFSTPRNGQARISTANTNRDGTGTVATLITAASTGTKVNEIVVKATGSTTAGMVRLYLSDGTNTRLLDEYAISVVNVAANIASVRVSTSYNNLYLPSGSSLLVSTHNAEQFDVLAFVADS